MDGETGEPLAAEPADEADTSRSASTSSEWTAQQDDDTDSADDQGPTYEELDDARRRYLQVERVGGMAWPVARSHHVAIVFR